MRNPNAAVSDPNEFYSDPGSEIHVLYSGKVLKDGKIELTKSGEENIQDKIDSYFETTDMAYILRQLSLGNNSVLDQREPMYGDFTKVPTTMMEATQMLIDAEAEFLKLPLETREKFDNNFRNWLFNAGNEEWFDKMGIVFPSDHLKESEVEVQTDVS